MPRCKFNRLILNSFKTKKIHIRHVFTFREIKTFLFIESNSRDMNIEELPFWNLISLNLSNINVCKHRFNICFQNFPHYAALLKTISTKTEWQRICLGHTACPAGWSAWGHNERRLEVEIGLRVALVAGQPHSSSLPGSHIAAGGCTHLPLY